MGLCRYLWCWFAFGSLCLLADQSSTNDVVTLQGGVIPVPGAGTNLNFKTETGATYRLLRTPYSEALFLDTNLHTKILLLKGKILRDKKAFEVTGNLHSIKDGKVQDLYYYCDICSIASSIPGLCQCCREPVRLVEEPAK
jgi:hypothetical protein